MIRESLQNPRQLTEEEIDSLNFDDYTTEELLYMVECGMVDKEDISAFYNNEWWDETP